MFGALVALAAALKVIEGAVVQYSYMRDVTSPNPKRTYVSTDAAVVLETNELKAWANASIDDRVAAFRRGLQRQQFRKHIENSG